MQTQDIPMQTQDILMQTQETGDDSVQCLQETTQILFTTGDDSDITSIMIWIYRL